MGSLVVTTSVGTLTFSKLSQDINKSSDDSLFNSLKNQINKSLNAFPEEISKKGSKFFEYVKKRIKEPMKEESQKLDEQWNIIKGGASAAPEYSKYAKTINYYLFEFKDFFKFAFLWIPNIIADSVMDSDDNHFIQLLSIQKIQSIVSNDKFKEFISSFYEVIKIHEDLFSKARKRNIDDIMDAFKSLSKDEDSISQTLEKYIIRLESVKSKQK